MRNILEKFSLMELSLKLNSLIWTNQIKDDPVCFLALTSSLENFS